MQKCQLSRKLSMCASKGSSTKETQWCMGEVLVTWPTIATAKEGICCFFKKNYKYSGLLWHRCASKEKLLGYFQRTANVRLGIPHLQGKLEYFQLFKILPRNCGFWLFVLSSGVISKAAFWIGTTWASRTQPFLALLLAPTCHPGSVLIAPERVLWTGTPCP